MHLASALLGVLPPGRIPVVLCALRGVAHCISMQQRSQYWVVVGSPPVLLGTGLVWDTSIPGCNFAGQVAACNPGGVVSLLQRAAMVP